MTTPPKVKKTVSLDAAFVDAVGEGNLSFEVNEGLRLRLAQQRRHVALTAWLDEMDEQEGPGDPDRIAAYERLLGGSADS